MTAKNAGRCRHGHPNICRMCNVVKVSDDLEVSDDGTTTWTTKWVAIGDSPEAVAEAEEAEAEEAEAEAAEAKTESEEVVES